jgi:hypothetical protein
MNSKNQEDEFAGDPQHALVLPPKTPTKRNEQLNITSCDRLYVQQYPVTGLEPSPHIRIDIKSKDIS